MSAGLAGVVFNQGLLNVHRFYDLPIFKTLWHKIAFALLTAGILGYYFARSFLGGGNNLINHLAHKSPVSLQLLHYF